MAKQGSRKAIIQADNYDLKLEVAVTAKASRLFIVDNLAAAAEEVHQSTSLMLRGSP